MNAPAPVQTPGQIRHSCMQKCASARHDILQSFAELELALAERISRERGEAGTPCPTFGAKLERVIKVVPAFKQHRPLIAIRNLMAHAHFDPVTVSAGSAILMRVSDHNAAMNARLILDDEWKSVVTDWRKAIEAARDQLAAP